MIKIKFFFMLLCITQISLTLCAAAQPHWRLMRDALLKDSSPKAGRKSTSLDVPKLMALRDETYPHYKAAEWIKQYVPEDQKQRACKLCQTLSERRIDDTERINEKSIKLFYKAQKNFDDLLAEGPEEVYGLYQKRILLEVFEQRMNDGRFNHESYIDMSEFISSIIKDAIVPGKPKPQQTFKTHRGRGQGRSRGRGWNRRQTNTRPKDTFVFTGEGKQQLQKLMIDVREKLDQKASELLQQRQKVAKAARASKKASKKKKQPPQPARAASAPPRSSDPWKELHNYQGPSFWEERKKAPKLERAKSEGGTKTLMMTDSGGKPFDLIELISGVSP